MIRGVPSFDELIAAVWAAPGGLRAVRRTDRPQPVGLDLAGPSPQNQGRRIVRVQLVAAMRGSAAPFTGNATSSRMSPLCSTRTVVDLAHIKFDTQNLDSSQVDTSYGVA